MIARRAPAQVMRLSRLGSLHQSRLSFMRILTRRMAGDKWTFTRPLFEIDANGVGRAVYTAKGPDRSYSLIAFAHDLDSTQRSDRVIATAWDTTFTLFDGVPTPADLDRLAANVPLQEAGRVSEKELTVSRANRSVRLWEHCVAQLASGKQPDPETVSNVGYLMRTTAVYGSGKLGAADHNVIADRVEMKVPFQAEMLTVYLIRTFVRDLMQHMANLRGGDQAVLLDPDIARGLGMGNSTGLGMAPFLINHPMLFNNWIMVREKAIVRVRAVQTASPAEVTHFHDIMARAAQSAALWQSDHPRQKDRIAELHADIANLTEHIKTHGLSPVYPWDNLINWATKNLHQEGQEWLNSLVLEPYSNLIDDLINDLSDTDDTAQRIDGAMTVGRVQELLKDCFGWALNLDWSDEKTCARAWYVSEEKQEPRLGERFEEPIADYEQPLAPARDAAAAFAAFVKCPALEPIATTLLAHPEHRHTVRRAQINARAPYSEIRDNTICADLMPIDMLRAKLSFFGATHFDPRSDRWVRICMFAGAPYPEELCCENACDWVYPP